MREYLRIGTKFGIWPNGVPIRFSQWIFETLKDLF